MITFKRVTKRKKVNGKTRDILSLVDIEIPSNRRIALFTPSAEDSNLVINLLAGIESPTSGLIRRTAKVSFPVGYVGGFQGELTVRHNIAHVARLYGADPAMMVDFIGSIPALRDTLNLRFNDFPRSLRRQFAQILTYSIPFDVYLLNVEPTSVPTDHREIACTLFEARTRVAGAIIAIRNAAFAKTHCDMALAMLDRKLVLFHDIEQALSASRGARTGAS